MMIGEFTNPFNILRKFYDFTGQKQNSQKIGIIFIGVFLICRVVVCPLLMVWVCLDPKMTILIKINSALMQWVSYIWAWRIVNMGLKVLSEVASV